MQTNDQNEAHDDAQRGINRIDDKHHDQSAHQAEKARVPCKIFECWTKIRCTGQFDAKTC